MSDEHVFTLEGGGSTKSGEPTRGSGGYSLNPKGQPHSALIARETIAFVVYSGELDRVELMEVIDAAPVTGASRKDRVIASPQQADHPAAKRQVASVDSETMSEANAIHLNP